jgi:uncharacterized membrane protein YkvA (DUF1232 family)
MPFSKTKLNFKIKGDFMSISEEQKQKAEQQFKSKAESVTQDDLKETIEKGAKKLSDLADNIPESLKDIWEDIKIMFALITDYIKGNYTDTPWSVITSIVAALLYFISPIDVVPDFIPILGFLDDAIVIKLAIDYAKKDLTEYLKWKDLQV